MMRFLIKIILFGFITINGYSFFSSSFKMQEIVQRYIQNVLDPSVQFDPAEIKTFFSLLMDTKNSQQLANAALSSSILGNHISQEEIDKLWILSTKASMDFSQALGIYICGRIIGLSILNNYKQLNSGQLKGDVSFDVTASEKAWIQTTQPVFNQLFANSTDENYITKKVGSFATLSQYKHFTNQIIASYQTDPKKIYRHMNQKNAVNSINWKDIVKTFETFVASEYCISWLNEYTTPKKEISRQVLSKLSKVPTEILILSGQRLLAQYPSNAFPQTITAYTLATTRNKSYQENLNNLIQLLINNKKVNAFEPLLLEKTPSKNKMRAFKK